MSAIDQPYVPTFEKADYAHILRAALAHNYTIGPCCRALSAAKPAMFLRHDVDFSLDFALEMAQIESEMSICSTYFVMPTNDYYNVYSKRGRDVLRSLVSLGHEVGLHWDSSLFSSQAEEAEQQFKIDVNILS